MKRLLSYLPPVLLLALAGGGYWWLHRQQQQLDTQLSYSTAVLATENGTAETRATRALQAMHAAVERNRNQPAEVARLLRAEQLHAQVRRTLAALYASDSLVRLAAGVNLRARNASGLRQPTYQPFTGANEPLTRQWTAAGRQLAVCADSLRPLGAAAAHDAALPAAAPGTTAVQVLADLAGTTQHLLDAEVAALQRLAASIPGNRLLPAPPLLLATAERNVVAPGDTYRARLLLAAPYRPGLGMRMSCNGRPVPIDSLGIGRVWFRAPRQPGPAAWMGTIRLTQLGRDTTFVVRVPYRVARR